MLDIVFLFLFFITPFSIYYLMKVTGEKLTRVSIVTFTVISTYCFSIIGTLPLFFQLDAYRVYMGVTDKTTVFLVFLYSFINIVCLLLGVAFFYKVLNFKPHSIMDLSNIKAINKNQFIILLLLFFICLMILYFYSKQINQFAIFVALKFGATIAGLARSDMGNNFLGKYHWYSLIIHDLANLITYILFAAWLKKKSPRYLLFFITSFSYSFFTAIMAIEKAPMAWLLIGLFFIYCGLKHNFFIPMKEFFSLTLVILILLGYTYVYFMGQSSLSKALSSVVSRSFSGSIMPAYFYLKHFPSSEPYLYGQTFPNPGSLLPFKPVHYTVNIMNIMDPNGVKEGVVGSAPTVFWGEAYINFGPLGIPIIAFLIGMLLGLISYLVGKLERNPISLGFNVYLILHFKDLSITGFSGYFIDFKLIVLTALILLIQTSGFMQKFIYRKRFICS